MRPDERLPASVIDTILQSDTVFLGTTYKAKADGESGVDVLHEAMKGFA